MASSSGWARTHSFHFIQETAHRSVPARYRRGSCPDEAGSIWPRVLPSPRLPVLTAECQRGRVSSPLAAPRAEQVEGADPRLMYLFFARLSVLLHS